MYFDLGKNASAQGQKVMPAPAIGDEAFFVSSDATTALYVRKGGSVFNFSMSGSVDRSRAMEAEALAKDALSKFCSWGWGRLPLSRIQSRGSLSPLTGAIASG